MRSAADGRRADANSYTKRVGAGCSREALRDMPPVVVGRSRSAVSSVSVRPPDRLRRDAVLDLRTQNHGLCPLHPSEAGSLYVINKSEGTRKRHERWRASVCDIEQPFQRNAIGQLIPNDRGKMAYWLAPVEQLFPRQILPALEQPPQRKLKETRVIGF